MQSLRQAGISQAIHVTANLKVMFASFGVVTMMPSFQPVLRSSTKRPKYEFIDRDGSEGPGITARNAIKNGCSLFKYLPS